MNHTFAIIKKEFKSYFNSPIAYVFISVFLVVSSWLFFRDFFLAGQASMRSFFVMLPWVFLFLIPAVTMRLWSEERKLGTTEVLFTWPIKNYEPVLGKFFSSFFFMALTLLLTLPIAVTVGQLGHLDWGSVIGSYVGSLFLAAAYLAIGLWISGLTDNQIIAFIVSIALCFAFFIIGEPIVTYALPQRLAGLFSFLGLGSHFASISRGVFDSRDIIYYLSIIVFFVYLNTRTIARRSWK